MTDKKKDAASLASELDQTHWDYQPRKDRKLLLAPMARLLRSVAWEFRPRHLRPASVPDEIEIETETIEDIEAARKESVERSDERK